MSRDHAPAVKELAARIAVSMAVEVYGPYLATQTPEQLLATYERLESVIRPYIFEALAPLLDKSREACIALVSTKSLSREHLSVKLDAELARWETPKTEAK